MKVDTGNVLIVDGAATSLQETAGHLTESGYTVITAATPEESLKQLDESAPSLVILRDDHPTTELLTLLQTLKTQSDSTPILLLAPVANAALILDALHRGADDHLPTPLADPGLLLSAVERNLAGRRHREQMARIEAELKDKNRILTENLRELERDQQTGLQVQRSMMPESPFTVGSLTFSHHVLPSLILSGDFIDYFELPDGRVLFYIADVSGHGSSSAFVTVLLKNLSRRLAREFERLALESTAEVLSWLNGEIMESSLDKHVTMFLGIVDQQGGSLEYSNAAHFPGAILSGCERTEYLEVGGLPLGLYNSVAYEVRSLQLPVNFKLVMFSDGVFEVMQQETLRAKEDHLLELVASGLCEIDLLAEHLDLDRVSAVPDDIALFIVSGSAQ